MFVAIIVTYHQNNAHVLKMVKELHLSDLKVIVFDNTPINLELSKNTSKFTCESVNILGDGINYGLATAYNKSIQFAYDNFLDIEGFIFFDQDSELQSSNVLKIIKKYYFLKSKKIPIGVLGALPVNIHGCPYLVREPKIKSCFDLKDFMEAEFVISSFSLVPVSTFKKVGFFDDKLFIDLVDSEFSFRCTRFNLLNLVSKDVSFKHIIGERRGNLFWIKNYAISSPIRNYYQARNLILVGKKYGLMHFCFYVLSKRFVQVILSAMYDGKFLKRFRYFFKGIYDGVRGKGGIYCD